ncbi:hypothetical protein Taro_041986 [Colocasia esculenta]|uniref:Uncharacterized protein n=1 Tax=Colocasia esculenta TaxID=4460 RepID=A0A843WH92_COLES|nr:hypothetical protein [Colocasia esculenta]
MGVVSKMYCKIWKKDFTKHPVTTKELIFRDLQLTYQWERTDKTNREMLAHMSAIHFNDKSLDDAITSVPAGANFLDWQTMCEMWTTGDEWESMTQMIAPSSNIDAESHIPVTSEDAFISVMGKDRPGRIRCAGSGETLSTWYKSIGTSANVERERIMQE